MCQLLNGTLEVNRLVAAWDHVDALIRPIIPDEVDTVWGGVDPLADGPQNNYQAEYVRIRQWIQDRMPWLRGELEHLGHTCPEGCQEGEREACDFLTCAGERVCEGGLWTGCRSTDEEVCGNLVDDDCDGDVDEDCDDGDTGGDSETEGGGDDGGGPDDGGDGDGDADDGGGDGGGDDGGANGSADGDADGCGCRTTPRAPPGVLFVVALARRQRRSRGENPYSASISYAAIR
jgi:hypothetical protein